LEAEEYVENFSIRKQSTRSAGFSDSFERILSLKEEEE